MILFNGLRRSCFVSGWPFNGEVVKPRFDSGLMPMDAPSEARGRAAAAEAIVSMVQGRVERLF